VSVGVSKCLRMYVLCLGVSEQCMLVSRGSGQRLDSVCQCIGVSGQCLDSVCWCLLLSRGDWAVPSVCLHLLVSRGV
jgi:hypothetical protein